MSHFPLHILFVFLIVLILISAFFSAAETGMMSINRYRLRHLARKKNQNAVRVQLLLKRPDRLLGVVLIGNTFANIFASAITTILAVHFFNELGVLIATIILTLVILIFAEITPKTLAAIHPEPVAFGTSLPLKYLLKIIYPLVWVANAIANGFLKIFRVKLKKTGAEPLSREELKSVVYASAQSIASHPQNMLLGVLDLEKISVDDIMVPKNEIKGVDLDEPWEKILSVLNTAQHTRLPVYHGNIDAIQGILHLRSAFKLLAKASLNQETLLAACEKISFVPEGSPLSQQLAEFQKQKLRMGLVVDEYGNIQGLVTLEDMLEEIVGEFTTDVMAAEKLIKPSVDNSYLLDGSMTMREINRVLGVELPQTGPKTISGWIIEMLEIIPQHKVCLRIAGYPFEVVELEGNTIKTVKIYLKQKQ